MFECVCVYDVADTDWQEEEESQWQAMWGQKKGGGACSSFPAAGPFVVGVPVLLLTLDGAIRRVPAAVVHGLLLAVVTLKTSRIRSNSEHTLRQNKEIFVRQQSLV